MALIASRKASRLHFVQTWSQVIERRFKRPSSHHANVARRRCTTESELAHTALHAKTLNLDDDYTITGNGCVGADALWIDSAPGCHCRRSGGRNTAALLLDTGSSSRIVSGLRCGRP